MWWTAIAAADCSRANVFRAADHATRVLDLEVVAAGRGRVREVLKGPPLAELPFPLVGPEDYEAPQVGHTYVVFVEGEHLAGCTALLDVHVARDLAQIRAVREWLASPDRVAMLVREGVAGREVLAEDALAMLGATPSLLVAVTPAQRSALVARIAAPAGDEAGPLAFVLARLGAAESVPAWVAWLEATPSGTSPTPVIASLALLTNHPPTGWIRGRDLYGADLVAARAEFAAWWARWRDRPLAEAQAAGGPGELADLLRRNACELAHPTATTGVSPYGPVSGAPACP